MSRSTENALKELDILALNREINADFFKSYRTGTWQQSNLEMPESTDWDELTKPRGVPQFFGPITKFIGDLTGNIDEILPTTPADKYIPNWKTMANFLPGVGDLDTGEYSILDALGIVADIYGGYILKARKGLTIPSISKKDSFLKRELNRLTDTTPSQFTKDLISFGKEEAIKDFTSMSGFDRFINTNLKATGQSWFPGFYDDFIKNLSSGEKKSLYEAYKGFVSSRVRGAEPQKFSKLRETTSGALGEASRSNAPGKSFIRLNEGKYNKHVSDYWKNRGKVTAQHEATHKATLIDDPGIKAIELMLEQKGFPMKSSKSPIAVSYLKDNLFQPRYNKKFITTKSGKSLALKDNWETNYFEKISEPGILKKGVEATPPQVGVSHKWNDDYDKYALQPLEIVGRIAPIRRLRSLANPTKVEKKLLKRLEKRELNYFTKDGLDHAVDKLWVIVPMLNLEEELAK